MKSCTYNGTTFDLAAPDTLEFENDYYRIIYETFYVQFDGSTLLPHIDFDNFIQNNFNVTPEQLALNEQIKVQKNPISKTLYPFFLRYPVFSGVFENITVSSDIIIAHAEYIVGAKCSAANFISIKKIIDDWNRVRWTRDQKIAERQSGVSTLGTISERLLETALESFIDETQFFKNTNTEIQSYGDFVLMALPNNLWLSVKSNFARERLLASGFSTDIIGVGSFTDHNEFTSSARIRNFQKVGFLAMYIPDIPITKAQVDATTSTYELAIDHFTAKNLPLPVNINGKPFLRKLSDIPNDIGELLSEKNLKKRTTIGF
ncbi:hypothetical protein FHS77_003198 [Paenochrobactrum gallinarii]|uniref:Uncharacterized protein n=1 Tax=Paenochrobactrum gallinarii TaxID=643673 RepID=A0A841LYX3_9HYPH|nr:hypothetical protein [Paenochrobactrum gallinarii]MBB6262616.1 hypothetical protein [Paenochrobactrum gallinarii]